MDKQQIVTHVGSGIIGAMMGYLGFRSKVARLETSIVFIASEIKEIKKSQVKTQRVVTNFQGDISALLERTKKL